MSEEHRAELLLTRKVCPLLQQSLRVQHAMFPSLHTFTFTVHRCCSRASSRRPR
jgi:hypothetical protein